MASRRRILALPLGLFGAAALGAAAYLWRSSGARPEPDLPVPLPADRMAELYADALPRSSGPLRGFHIGHSLVGRDMPAMLMQLAAGEYSYESQLGWGATLRSHWEPDEAINGFEVENDHPRYRDAHEALASGDYDLVVLTEMVEIRDAIAYHRSWDYLERWATRAREGNRDARVYLYETWHQTNDPEGWLERIDADLDRHWLDQILRPALAQAGGTDPIYLIPGGQVMAAFVRAAGAHGELTDVDGIGDLMLDRIHFNDLGAYLIALTHYAVIFRRSPVGLPHNLTRADGTPATAPTPETAALMQQTVWDVVTAMPLTGVVGASTIPLTLSNGPAAP